MNIRDLSYIIAVADTGHFGKAAEMCFVSQPTLSGQIKKLEETLGVTIFERNNRHVEVTVVGEEIIAYARKILSEVETIRSIAATYQDPLAGPLKIGAIPTLSPYLMPLILSPIQKEYPQMKLILSEETTEQLLVRLKQHEIDAALLATDIEDPEFIAIPLFQEPFWVAYPRNHHFYNRDTITTKDLDNEHLLLLAKGHCLADQARSICQMASNNEDNETADIRASSLQTLIQLVSADYGITLLPALAMGGSLMSGTGVVAQPLENNSASRTVSLVYRRSFPRTRALGAFSDLTRNNLPNTVQKL